MLQRAGSIAFGLSLFVAAGILASRPLGYDFASYWLGSRHLIEGAPLYPSSAASGGVFLGFGEFLYEPLVAVAFIPFALLPFVTAAWAWTALLIAIAAAVGAALVRPLSSELRPWAAAAYALYLPLLAEITLGNLNLVTVALVLLAWRLRDRPRLGGAVLAGAIALKLLPIAMLLFYAGARRWRLVGWSLATGAAAIAISMPFLSQRWAEYLQLLASVARESSEFAINVVPPAIAASPLRWLLPIAAAALAWWCGTRLRAEDRAHHLALAAAPLISPLIWYPYLVFAAPALLVTAALGGLWRYAAIVAFLALELPSGRAPLPYAAFAGLLAVLVIATGSLVLRTTGELAARTRTGDSGRARSARA